MIFHRDHGQELRASGAPGATTLLVLHFAIYAAVALFFEPPPLEAAMLGVLLIAISVVDVQRFEIPDLFSALLVLGGFVALWSRGGDWLDHGLAALLFPAILYSVGVAYMQFRGLPGLGLGDVKLAAGLGLWLGIEASIWTLLTASVSGIATLLVIAVTRRTSPDALMTSGIAFGPFLCLSAWVMWLQGNAT